MVDDWHASSRGLGQAGWPLRARMRRVPIQVSSTRRGPTQANAARSRSHGCLSRRPKRAGIRAADTRRQAPQGKGEKPSAWREVTEKLRRVVVDHQVRPAAPDSMAPPAAIPPPTPAATCMDTPLCFEDGRIQTASTERVCDFLRFAKQPKNFHLLLRPCATGLIVANSSLGAHQSWQASKVLLVFPSWIQNFGESVMRTASTLKVIKRVGYYCCRRLVSEVFIFARPICKPHRDS